MDLKGVFALMAGLQAISMSGEVVDVRRAEGTQKMMRQGSVMGGAPGGDACGGQLAEAQARIQTLEAELQQLRGGQAGSANMQADLLKCQQGTDSLAAQLRECNDKFNPLQQRVEAQAKDIQSLTAAQQSAGQCMEQKGALEASVAQLQQQLSMGAKAPASVKGGSAPQGQGGPFPDMDSCVAAYMQLKASAQSASIQQQMGHIVIGSSRGGAQKNQNGKKIR
jgi:hypothetical protein